MTFSFGAAPATPAASSTGFTLGAPPAKAPAAGSGFGGFGAGSTTATSTAPPAFGGFGAGTSAATTSAPPPAFGGFGTGTTTAAAPTLGATTSAPAFGGFGTTTTTAAAPTLGGFGATAATSTAPPAFGGFGVGSTSAAPTLGGFGAATTASTAAVAPTLGGFGAPATTAPTLGGFGLGVTSTSTTTTVTGLGGNTTGGGILGSQGGQQAGKPADDTKTDATSTKESPIPAELAAVVEALKTMIKEEKSVSSEISHTTDKGIKQVKEDTEALKQMVSGITSTLQNNRLKLDQLKQTCGQELVNVDIAVKTRDTPASMQYDNVAPLDYFARLVTQFEQSMLEYRQAIVSAETHLQAVAAGAPGLSPGDIVSAVQRMQQGLTHLAAKYQVLHTTINEYKSQFRVQSKVSALPPASLSGPSPFLAPADPLTLARQTLSGSHGPPVQSLGQQQSAFAAAPALAPGGSAFNTSGLGNSSMFGSSAFGASNSTFGSSANSSVTVGTKRNKH